MTGIKFKIGEKYRVIKNLHGHKFSMGETVTCTNVYFDGEIGTMSSLQSVQRFNVTTSEVEPFSKRKHHLKMFSYKLTREDED